jgi:4-alpha-glucanotransferase
LHAHHLAQLGPASGWRDWPVHLHDPRGEGVRNYATQHEAEVSFHAFLQWMADAGLQHAQKSAREAGMSVGLIADLAIGTDARGSHAWSRQGEMLEGVSVGAPPDLFQAEGQNWGLTAFSPRALRQNAYAAFIETVRAVLAHAGGVRIDHILGMSRMWLVPPGASAADGVYLHYPMQDMLRLLVLEAWRHKALVVGENLGTVPEGFNDQLEHKGILGTSVLWFERSPATRREPDAQAGKELQSGIDDMESAEGDSVDAAAFLPPAQWPAWTMATPTTHDLPTIRGWWSGRDLEWRGSGKPDAQEASARQRDKTALWQALQDAGCVSAKDRPPEHAPREAVLSYVSKTPSPIVIVSLEDLLGLLEQPNLPGSDSHSGSPHPNWIQCLPAGVDEIFNNAEVASGIAAIKRARRKT